MEDFDGDRVLLTADDMDAWLEGVGARLGLLRTAMLVFCMLEAVSVIEGVSWLSDFGVSGTVSEGVAVFLKNISRMFRRLLNSGMSFADMGRRSLGDHSRRRLPSLNMPSGFMMSGM